MGDSSGFKLIPTDKITAFATSMAAIAAIASGTTAVLQLRATFNSQLYNQQIERIGAMLADSEKQRDEVMATSREAKTLADQVAFEGRVKTEMASGAFEQYNAKMDALRRESYAFDIKIEQLGLVLPRRMDRLIVDMLSASVELRKALSSETPLECETYSRITHCEIKNVDQMARQSAIYADRIDEDSAKIEWCAIVIIRAGHLVTNDNINHCDLLPAADSQRATRRAGPAGGKSR